MTRRSLCLLVSTVATTALCIACGSSGSGGGTGGTSGAGAGGAAGSSATGGAAGSSATGGAAGSSGTGGANNNATQCGSTTCTANQVCAQQGCGGALPPDGGSCTPPAPKCVALPAGCKVNPTCTCFDSIWTTLSCGTIRYGTLKCERPCA